MANLMNYEPDSQRSLDLRQELIAAGFVIERWGEGTRLTLTHTWQGHGAGDSERSVVMDEAVAPV